MTTDLASLKCEYDALQDGAGYVELTGWSSVTLTGADRKTFLHSFCTNDVKQLAPGESCEAFVTNVKGKTIGHGQILCCDDELVFVTVPNQVSALIAHFDRYVIREDVQLRDTSAERAYFYVRRMLSEQAGMPTWWNSWRLPKEAGVLIEVPMDDAPRFRQLLLERNCRPCGVAAFEALRIEAGIPLFGVDFDEHNFPQEVGRDRVAISFTKGCYLGQETVARIDALGHVNQQLVGVKFAGSDVPAAGVELLAGGAKVGRVTSATCSPMLGAPLALAMVRREANAPGTRLESAVGPGDVVMLPLGEGAKPPLGRELGAERQANGGR